jgi:hypothetical protein
LTAADLLAELSQVQSAFIWRLTPNRRIRGCLRNVPDQRVFDPVTAVVFFRTGEFFPEGHWAEAAAAIGLQYSDCAEIVAASNYEWDSSCPQGMLRRKLSHALMPKMQLKKENKESSLADVFLRNSRKRPARPADS